ncbi:hypothetical protein GCM10017784_41460 [Deinococcus indicus]|nr:hypothetical protein GCM10017784_41460 [Deinococcus indicus]
MQTYLEYSEEGGSAHKFYEARVDDCTLTLRYGRIGTDGQTQVKTFASPQAAAAEATKKLAEKRRKGYMEATLGEREKRNVPQPALRLPRALAPYRGVLEATVRPSVRLRGVRAPARPWSSKLGGVPYRLLGTDAPLSRDGHPLTFLAQLNFAEFPALPGFPAQGIVQFFIRDDDYYGANFDSSLNVTSLGDDANFRVLYHPEVVQDTARLELAAPAYQPDPDGNGLPHDPAQEFVLRGELMSGPVTGDDRLFEHLVGQSLWQLGGEMEEDGEADPLTDRYARLAGAGHKLGGYPNFTQQDPRRPEDPHVLLFQLDSDDDLDLMWGDVGIANFFIPPDDLARGDFSHVVYHWDCC